MLLNKIRFSSASPPSSFRKHIFTTSSQIISRFSLGLHHFLLGRSLCLRDFFFSSEKEPNPLQGHRSLWLTWKGQGGIPISYWGGTQRQLQLWFTQLYPQGTCIHGFLTLCLHTFVFLAAFPQGCDLISTLLYAQHYSPAKPIKVFYCDEKKTAQAWATPIMGPQCQFEDNYLHTNAYQ